MLMKITASESVSRIFKIHTKIPFHPYVFWLFCRECPRYKKYVHLAIRLIGLMFCGK